MQLIVQNIIRFVVLLLVQVMVLNHVRFLGFINPYLYILFVLSLPLKTPRWLQLVLAFVMGVCVDIFSDSLGLHAFATVLVAFLRDPLIRLLVTSEENADYTPSLATLGRGAYVKYLSLTVAVHHTVLFFMETFTLTHAWITLLHALLSAAITIAILLGVQLLNRR